MFFLGVASGVVFITLFFLIIANKNKPIEQPKWMSEQLKIMEERNILMKEENKLCLRAICATESMVYVQHQMLKRSAIPGAAGNCPAEDGTPNNGLTQNSELKS